jgi:hypothetical protein
MVGHRAPSLMLSRSDVGRVRDQLNALYAIGVAIAHFSILSWWAVLGPGDPSFKLEIADHVPCPIGP